LLLFRKEGGYIVKGRVSGSLAVSRALGDLELKTQGVSNVPDIEEIEITNKTNFLIIASDGLWDVCEDQKAVDLVKTLEQANTMATTLVKYAKMNGSKDNVSVMILKF
jgi:serine/threonine protein phosphatase PrpC